MATTLSSGPSTILASGLATTFFGYPLELQLALPEGPYVLRFHFLDEPGSGPSARTRIGDRSTDLDLINFDAPEGRGSARPVLIHELGVDLLFLHFRAFHHGDSPDHHVHYTVFRVPKVAVDWQPATSEPA